MPEIVLESLDVLKSRLGSRLARPTDPDWDAARRPWNLAVEQNPAAVAEPADIGDVRAVLASAQEAGLGVTVQPHGHGAHDDLEGVILVRPHAFRELSIDVEARIARVGAGVDWGSVLTALDGTGLVALAGSNPAVSVVGYCLGGGHSPFGRAFGLAANSVTAVELVLADGTATRVDAATDGELFWALRGGGGLFGVVTAIEIALHPLPVGGLYGGKLTFPGASAESVLAAMFDAIAAAPDALGLSGGMVSVPDAPTVPEHLRGQVLTTVDVVSLAGEQHTEAMIAPIRAAGRALADTIAPFSMGDLPAVAAEPVDPVGAIDASSLLGDIDARFVHELVAGFRSGVGRGLSLLQLRPLGGAIARERDDQGVAGHLDAGTLLGASVIGFGSADRAAGALECVLAPARRVRVDGRVVTFLGAGETLGAAYPPESVARLRAVKARVDPAGIMRSNRPLP